MKNRRKKRDRKMKVVEGEKITLGWKCKKKGRLKKKDNTEGKEGRRKEAVCEKK